jgi:hypothetical protein
MSSSSSPSRTRGHPLQPLHREVLLGHPLRSSATRRAFARSWTQSTGWPTIPIRPVVIGGGDFVSFAGEYRLARRPASSRSRALILPGRAISVGSSRKPQCYAESRGALDPRGRLGLRRSRSAPRRDPWPPRGPSCCDGRAARRDSPGRRRSHGPSANRSPYQVPRLILSGCPSTGVA